MSVSCVLESTLDCLVLRILKYTTTNAFNISSIFNHELHLGYEKDQRYYVIKIMRLKRNLLCVL